jgi:AcrR family transcriptional regulator
VTSAPLAVRPLSPAQVTTRRALLDATISLALAGGYDAITMRAVAKQAGVSAPTAYQHFASKDHLLVEVMIERVNGTTAAVMSKPERGRTAIDRTVATLRRAMRRVEDEPNLYIAMMRAYISGVPEVAHLRNGMETSMQSWVDTALGSTEVIDREAVIAILEAVLFAGMVGLVTGGKQPGDVADDLERAARRLLEPR